MSSKIQGGRVAQVVKNKNHQMTAFGKVCDWKADLKVGRKNCHGGEDSENVRRL